MRTALVRAMVRPGGVDAQQEDRAPDLHRGIGEREPEARASKAFGIEVESTRPPSISRNSSTRTGVCSGSSQLVIQAV